MLCICAAVDTASNPRAPSIYKTVQPTDIQSKTDGQAYLHTSHCLPSGEIMISTLGDPSGAGRGAFFLLDQDLKVNEPMTASWPDVVDADSLRIKPAQSQMLPNFMTFLDVALCSRIAEDPDWELLGCVFSECLVLYRRIVLSTRQQATSQTCHKQLQLVWHSSDPTKDVHVPVSSM